MATEKARTHPTKRVHFLWIPPVVRDTQDYIPAVLYPFRANPVEVWFLTDLIKSEVQMTLERSLQSRVRYRAIPRDDFEITTDPFGKAVFMARFPQCRGGHWIAMVF